MGSPCNTFGNEPDPGSAGSRRPRRDGQRRRELLPHDPPCGARSRAPRPARCRATGTRPSAARTMASTAAPATPTTSTTTSATCSWSRCSREGSASASTYSSTTRCSSTPVRTARCSRTRPPFGTTGNANNYVTNAEARNRYVQRAQRQPQRLGSAPATAIPGAGSGLEPQGQADHLVRAAAADRHPEPEAGRGPERHGRRLLHQAVRQLQHLEQQLPARVCFQTAATPATTADVAQAFHNWVSLCTFTPTRCRGLLPPGPHEREPRPAPLSPAEPA